MKFSILLCLIFAIVVYADHHHQQPQQHHHQQQHRQQQHHHQQQYGTNNKIQSGVSTHFTNTGLQPHYLTLYPKTTTSTLKYDQQNEPIRSTLISGATDDKFKSYMDNVKYFGSTASSYTSNIKPTTDYFSQFRNRPLTFGRSLNGEAKVDAINNEKIDNNNIKYSNDIISTSVGEQPKPISVVFDKPAIIPPVTSSISTSTSESTIGKINNYNDKINTIVAERSSLVPTSTDIYHTPVVCNQRPPADYKPRSFLWEMENIVVPWLQYHGLLKYSTPLNPNVKPWDGLSKYWTVVKTDELPCGIRYVYMQDELERLFQSHIALQLEEKRQWQQQQQQQLPQQQPNYPHQQQQPHYPHQRPQQQPSYPVHQHQQQHQHQRPHYPHQQQHQQLSVVQNPVLPIATVPLVNQAPAVVAPSTSIISPLTGSPVVPALGTPTVAVVDGYRSNEHNTHGTVSHNGKPHYGGQTVHKSGN